MKIAIIDDNYFFVEAFEVLIDLIGNVDLIQKAKNVNEFLERKDLQKLDMLFIDIKLPLANRIRTIRRTLKIKPSIKIICLSNVKYSKIYKNVIDAGAKKWIIKDDLSVPLIEKIINE